MYLYQNHWFHYEISFFLFPHHFNQYVLPTFRSNIRIPSSKHHSWTYHDTNIFQLLSTPTLDKTSCLVLRRRWPLYQYQRITLWTSSMTIWHLHFLQRNPSVWRIQQNRNDPGPSYSFWCATKWHIQKIPLVAIFKFPFQNLFHIWRIDQSQSSLDWLVFPSPNGNNCSKTIHITTTIITTFTLIPTSILQRSTCCSTTGI